MYHPSPSPSDTPNWFYSDNKVDLIHSLLTHFRGPGSPIWLTFLMECAHTSLQPSSAWTVSLPLGCWGLMLYECDELSTVLPFVPFDTLVPISLQKNKVFIMRESSLYDERLFFAIIFPLLTLSWIQNGIFKNGNSIMNLWNHRSNTL